VASVTVGRNPEDACSEQRVPWIWAAVPLWIAYALIFAGTEGASLWKALRDGAANVAPLIALALACRTFLPRFIHRRPLPVQGAVHALAALAFSASWYASVTLLLGLSRWLSGAGFHIVGFTGPALPWQMLQGAILYCAVAAIVLRSSAPSNSQERSKALQRYLIRDGEDFRPIEVMEIVSIRGAQDYAEVSTRSGQHLVRMSLGEFEARLDPEQFVRVHRSAIVHLRHLERLEPAGGGRMLAHMGNGQRVAVSRAGAQTLRLFVV
jgi:two-component system, LytTR family, response regulator